jgi:hypothetical protein
MGGHREQVAPFYLEETTMVQETTMVRLRNLLGSALLLVLASLPSPSMAFDLNGIWATDPALCGKMFEKHGNEIAFTPLSDLYGSGFVVDDTRIKGKMAQCTIQSRNEEANTLRLVASCATAIMQSTMQFTLKVLDQNSISRLFTGMEGMAVTYYRCAL